MKGPSVRRLPRLLSVSALIAALALAGLPAAASATPVVCLPTTFMRDGNPLTAAQFGGPVTGTLDATGCDIGVYYDPSMPPGDVNGGAISGARYFGVVVNGGRRDVVHSSVSNIGDTPFGGSQHGIGIYYTGESGTPTSGIVSDDNVSRYQKGGIVATQEASVSITNNTVTGFGPVDFIAQNGIQVSYGATAEVSGNSIYNNDYTPKAYIACGLLLYQASGVNTGTNLYRHNESNMCNFGKGGGNFSPTP
jgi:parallel beta helix pectate lyase-like protein